VSWRSALGRVRGYGAAKEGVEHWWTQRLTSVALIPLTCWFAVSLLALPQLNYHTVASWMSSGLNALWLMLFVLTASWHSQLGVRVVLEDYVHEEALKTLALAASTFAHVVIASAATLAVLRVALAGNPA
jgi:succinate dehydrogenase / fumarate reductase membrane anchor subunit